MAISFDNVKTVKPATKAKKSEKARVEIAGMHEYAALVAVMKSLEAVKASMEADIKAKMVEQFVTMGCERKARPDNFRGYEGEGEASCELRARSTTSPLSSDEQELLAKHKIPTTTVETVVDTFVINPAYIGDSELMGKVAAKLNQVKDIPQDFIMKQEGVSKTVIGEGALDVMFKLPAETVEGLLRTVGVLALKPKFENMENALDSIRHLVTVEG